MPDKEKVAFFDFCETLANFQTADAYVNYIRTNYGTKLMSRKENFRVLLQKSKIIDFLQRIFPHSSINKRLVLWQLRGFGQQELEVFASEYYKNVIKPNFISESVKEMVRLQEDGWRIVIVSAGYEIYLKYFAVNFGISLSDVIAVKIKFKNDKCCGCFEGGDRVWDKTDKMDSLFNKSGIESIAYSDSPSDIPMLNWADKAIVIRRNDKPKWDTTCKYGEIIWKK